jgi:hypothetical protein
VKRFLRRCFGADFYFNEKGEVSLRKLSCSIESYLKRSVNLGVYEALSDEKKGKFFDKCALELSLELRPKSEYGIAKDDFRDLVIDVFFKIFYGDLRFDLSYYNLFAYQNPFKETRLVIAKFKKDADEIACSFIFGHLNVIGNRKSLRKVIEIRKNAIVLDDDSVLEIESYWMQTVNLFDRAEGGDY